VRRIDFAGLGGEEDYVIKRCYKFVRIFFGKQRGTPYAVLEDGRRASAVERALSRVAWWRGLPDNSAFEAYLYLVSGTSIYNASAVWQRVNDPYSIPAMRFLVCDVLAFNKKQLGGRSAADRLLLLQDVADACGMPIVDAVVGNTDLDKFVEGADLLLIQRSADTYYTERLAYQRKRVVCLYLVEAETTAAKFFYYHRFIFSTADGMHVYGLGYASFDTMDRKDRRFFSKRLLEVSERASDEDVVLDPKTYGRTGWVPRRVRLRHPVAVDVMVVRTHSSFAHFLVRPNPMCRIADRKLLVNVYKELKTLIIKGATYTVI